VVIVVSYISPQNGIALTNFISDTLMVISEYQHFISDTLVVISVYQHFISDTLMVISEYQHFISDTLMVGSTRYGLFWRVSAVQF
jgi:putative component of membrane protein insertase Oxa1/YidC/SpoIIIJ protein YidD